MPPRGFVQGDGQFNPRPLTAPMRVLATIPSEPDGDATTPVADAGSTLVVDEIGLPTWRSRTTFCTNPNLGGLTWIKGRFSTQNPCGCPRERGYISQEQAGVVWRQ